MATLRLAGRELVVHLRMLEKFAALQRDFRVPLDQISSVDVITRPLPDITFDLRMGRAASTAPAATLVTVGHWRVRKESGRAFLAIYGNRPSPSITLEHQRWRRIVISHRDPSALADEVRAWSLSEGS